MDIAVDCAVNRMTAFLTSPSTRLGPMIDDGPPYAEIKAVELELLLSSHPSKDTPFDSLHDAVSHYKWRQYGDGNPCSSSRKLSGSVVLKCRTDESELVDVGHLVVEGSLQLVIGPNMSGKCNHLHTGDNRLQFPHFSGRSLYISLVDDATHRFVTLDRFTSSSCSFSSMFGHSAQIVAPSNHNRTPINSDLVVTHPPSDIALIVNRVHEHVCGLTSFGDRQSLLQRNKL